VAAGTRIDDGGKVPGKIVGVTIVIHRKSEGDLQRNLRRSKTPSGISKKSHDFWIARFLSKLSKGLSLCVYTLAKGGEAF